MQRVTSIENVRCHSQPGKVPQRVRILVEGDTIDEIVQVPVPEKPATALTIEAGAIDGGGAFVVPGLINLHTHLFRKVRADEEGGAVDNPVAWTLRALRNGRDSLAHGVTTVRELGAPQDLDISLADLQAREQVGAPRIAASGRPITQTGGHNHDFGVVADGPTAVRKAVRSRVLAGAQCVKLMGSYGGTRYFRDQNTQVPPDCPVEAEGLVDTIIEHADPSKTYACPEREGYTLEELKAGADESRRHRLPTAVHAVTPQSIVNSVRAKVGTVEHGTFLSAEGARMLADSATVYVPTISTVFNRIIYGRRDGWPAYLLRWAVYVAEPWFASLRLAYESGVTIGVGTDGGGDIHMEMQLLTRAGLSRHEALKAATETAAAVLDRQDLGRIAAGMKADLLLVDGDPLADLSVLRHPSLVVQGGRVAEKGKPSP